MSIGFNCCCAAPNPCNCTWPRVLSYAGSVAQAQSAFYFINTPSGGSPEPVYALTYQARPAEVPQQLQLLFYSAPGGVHDPWYVTMPDSAWFSDPIPITVFGIACHCYFYLWMQSCKANVMVIDAPYGSGSPPSATKGAGNNVFSYTQTQCNPQFQMKSDLSRPAPLYGTHGPDDLVPGAGASLGGYTNPRIGL